MADALSSKSLYPLGILCKGAFRQESNGSLESTDDLFDTLVTFRNVNWQGTSNKGTGGGAGEAGIDDLSRWSGVRTGRGGKVLRRPPRGPLTYCNADLRKH